MSGVLDRLVAAFVAPVEREEPAPGRWVEPTLPAPTAIAVLASPDRALAAGAAVALASGAAVVAVWGAETRGPRALATPRARRLATKLTDRGHDTTATGRLVLVALATPDEAARVAAAVDAAMVVVVAGARDAHVDRALSDHDQVLVAGADVVAHLAAASVRALGVPATTLAVPDAAAARLLATAGVALIAPWRAPSQDALA